ncbi:hypothetical protein BBK36DRAFT_1202822 [Trichoderma citrinoviride]|uniref:Uncharacterized protein n=1 Tax=Trichoderma citrinoviride TaxID=58853 RepID=A0A2T4B947_9HYPO|nr:hypothetical protein BBK36DRAFT_1202822 [Trichoderma citrinoviride]PTB65818.1 hypothetical protein BBK36DRAFT_1202822 [Trichoderma citrinoviride]
MAPHALLASRGHVDSLEMDDDLELGLVYPLSVVDKPALAAIPTSHDGKPRLEGYIIAATIVSICLVVCLAAVALVACCLCVKKARRTGRGEARHRPPTPFARGRASASTDEETTTPPIPLATLPAAKVAGKRLPANTAARRPGFFSGMEVARPLQVPFLDTVVEASSSEERVCEGAGEEPGEDANGAAMLCEAPGTDTHPHNCQIRHMSNVHPTDRRHRLIGGRERISVRPDDGPATDDPKLGAPDSREWRAAR